MPEKDPNLWSASAWGLAVLMAAGGGLINWFSRVKTGKARPFSLVELIGEMVTSGFTGIGVAMVLATLGYDFFLCAAAAGIGGHMATRLLFRVEHLIEARLAKYAPEGAEDHSDPFLLRIENLLDERLAKYAPEVREDHRDALLLRIESLIDARLGKDVSDVKGLSENE